MTEIVPREQWEYDSIVWDYDNTALNAAGDAGWEAVSPVAGTSHVYMLMKRRRNTQAQIAEQAMETQEIISRSRRERDGVRGIGYVSDPTNILRSRPDRQLPRDPLSQWSIYIQDKITDLKGLGLSRKSVNLLRKAASLTDKRLHDPIKGSDSMMVPPYLKDTTMFMRSGKPLDFDEWVMLVLNDEINTELAYLGDTLQAELRDVLRKYLDDKGKKYLAEPTGEVEGEAPIRMDLTIENFETIQGTIKTMAQRIKARERLSNAQARAKAADAFGRLHAFPPASGEEVLKYLKRMYGHRGGSSNIGKGHGVRAGRNGNQSNVKDKVSEQTSVAAARARSVNPQHATVSQPR